MSTARHIDYTYDDYLRVSRDASTKFEFLDGEIYAMAGGTPEHAALAGQLTVLIGSRIKAPCRVYSADLRVVVPSTSLATYPDLTVICGAAQTAENDENAVVNPSVLVEVTSKSTEAYDRGEKLSHYKQLNSLHTVLIVSHRRRQVTVVTRTAEGWHLREARPGESVTIEALGFSLEVDAMYGELVSGA